MANDLIARRRIHASGLAGKPFVGSTDVVGHHLAMQAQDYGPAKWAIGQRAGGLVDADVDRALAEGSIVRTHVLRPTWHFVAREDLRWLMAISGPRVQRGNAGRYRDLGLDARTRARAEKAIVAALRGGGRLTRKQLAEVLDRARIHREGQRMPYFLMHCELELVICSAGLEGKQQTYGFVDERVPAGGSQDPEDAVHELVRRYLASHGPATVKDLGWWSGFTMSALKAALGDLGDDVRSEEIDARTYWSVAGEEARSRPVRGAHLLQTYDELVVGYTESRFVGDPAAAAARQAWLGRDLPSGLFLLNGRVGGHWRRTIGPKRVDVEAYFYERPTKSALTALEREADRFGRFVGREVVLRTDVFMPSTAS
ncbi:MAG TPA: winged helix DNA-binding domain-containing protein [Actinomycetota bacterium]|nr:winged helix DNA-binding domain-containing protein [Actinomycetota bacterium]